MNSETKTCDMDGETYDNNGNERYWHCTEPAIDECCGGYYCEEHYDLHGLIVRHPCYCCNNTGVVVNKIGLIDIGQACVLCEGDV